uniref:Thioredoxin domain-containing protein n=1 Tax=Prevotella sp. GTC17259 TaxID=3236795 RepID=A0AB33JFR8_9BACT
MMKHLLFGLAILLASIGHGYAQSFVCRISGEVEDLSEKQLMLFESGAFTQITPFVTIEIKDGKFDYRLIADTLKCYTVCLKSEYERGSMRVAEFIAENAAVHITIPARTREEDDGIKIVADGEENGMMMKYIAYKDSMFALYDPKFKKLETERESLDRNKQLFKPIVYEIYSKMEHAQDAQRDSLFQLLPKDRLSDIGAALMAKYEDLKDVFRVDLVKWFESNKCFYSLAGIRNQMLSNRLPKTQARLADMFLTYYVDYMPEHPYTQEIAYEVAASRLQKGKKYIDYDVRGIDGRNVKLSSLYTGKIILIDMWASWCGPCRRRAKAIIPVYEKYKDKGFQVIGIAREMNMENMKSAIEKDGYPWLNLLELNDQHAVWLKNGLQSSAGGSFLIDEQGTILAVYPEADELEKILQERL